jgi:glutathione synthase/RimK-type ligase-like ATP-grasp enzyme
MAFTFFIASSFGDRINTSPVAQLLKSRSHRVITYDAELIFTRQLSMCCQLGGNAPKLDYCNGVLDLEEVSAAWLRRPNRLGRSFADKAAQLCMEREVKDLQYPIFGFIDEEKWLNSPAQLHAANYKLTQLNLAKQIGFTVPHTVVSNDWQSLLEALPDQKLVVKMQSGSLYRDNKPMGMPTVLLDRADIQALIKQKASPFPALFQPYIPKKREWRVTVVGDQIFEAAIYTDEEAKVDWRTHQHTSKVRFRRGTLDSDIRKKCLLLLERLHLRFGAFDFIESPDGTITFLEVNPNGQFMWLEHDLGLPISQAIADELIRIAEQA